MDPPEGLEDAHDLLVDAVQDAAVTVRAIAPACGEVWPLEERGSPDGGKHAEHDTGDCASGRRSGAVTGRTAHVAVAVSALVLAAGCSWIVPDDSVGSAAVPTTTAATTTTAPSTTMVVPPAVTNAVPVPVAPAGGPASTGTSPAPPVGPVPPQGLGEGDRGPQVEQLERRLDALRYDVGPPNDVFDATTRHAVVAFQKVEGLPVTGRATQDVVDRLAVARPPSPLVPGGGVTRVEVDLVRQVLLLFEGDALFRVLPVSTGSGKRFCEGGRCRRAVTPPGKFVVYKRISGWRKSDLGRLYNPVYFNEGIAIHGFPSVPPRPASHGCVRIPMSAAEWFPQRVPDGTPVYVLDGKTAAGR